MLHNDPIAAITPEVISWRHRIHANPELGFQERETAHFVAQKLRARSSPEHWRHGCGRYPAQRQGVALDRATG
jgi:metal-dependent amidase/aminoacylase/carboxypeptidase family protein